ncbi:ATP-binding protein [Desulfurivibrio sp. D14AmB]|uniref:ATP-binding protein n=1 Tax=Desulfurivibrio sp. D14AmB TaxID=3374370 RepID=UPI00376ECB52
MPTPNTSRSPLPPNDSSGIVLSWLLRLRWWVISCQILLVASIILLFDVAVPLTVLGLIIGFQLIGNLFFRHLARRGRKLGENAFTAVLLTDILLFTALLYTTGGPMNPFTFLYLIHIALAAILVHPRRAALLATAASLAYFALFILPPYAPSLDLGLASLDTFFTPCHVGSDTVDLFGYEVSPHLQGMWVAFAITAFFVVFFVGQAHQALEAHRRMVRDLREQQIKSEKLASLATLAAGAAHELSTPLGTIAVASKEMRLQLNEECEHGDLEQRRQTRLELLEDLDLIRGQVDRCKEIIYQMAADAGEHLGEETRSFPLAQAMAQALSHFSPEERQRVLMDDRAGDLRVRMPFRTLSRIIRGLVKNGLDASPPDGSVELESARRDGFLLITVRDRGAGMDHETRQRAGEPFYTTKEPGQGLGLGLFLARSAAERFGGRLEIQSLPGQGTTVHLSFALNKIS